MSNPFIGFDKFNTCIDKRIIWCFKILDGSYYRFTKGVPKTNIVKHLKHLLKILIHMDQQTIWHLKVLLSDHFTCESPLKHFFHALNFFLAQLEYNANIIIYYKNKQTYNEKLKTTKTNKNIQKVKSSYTQNQ